MINYSYVYLYNDLNEFEKSLVHLNKIELDYFTYKYDVYNLKVKIYYELEYFESALELIHTYTQYIRNDKLLERSLKIGHNNFLKYTEQLILYRLAKESIQLGFLKKKIQKSDNLFHKKWLIEKIESLK